MPQVKSDSFSSNQQFVDSPPRPKYWSKKKAAVVITASLLVAGALTGGIALALAAGVATIAGAAIGAGTVAGAVSGYFANRKIRKFKSVPAPENDVIPLPSMAKKAHSIFAQFLGQGDAPKIPTYPNMNHSLGAHFFGGAFISDATLAGEKLEGNQFSEVFSFVKHCLGSDQPNEEMRPLLKSVDQVLEIENELRVRKGNYDFGSFTTERDSTLFAEWIIEKIDNLAVNEPLLIPGGWIGRPAGHAMLYEIIRQENGKFTMNVYNSGAGSDYHPQAEIGGKLKHLPYLNQKDIDPSMLLSPFVWRGYYEHRNVIPSEESGFARTPSGKRAYGAYDIYEGWLKAIHPQFGQAAHAHAEKAFNPDDYISPQMAGTCSADCLFSWLHARMGRPDNAPSQKKNYKFLKKAITFEALVQYSQYLAEKGIFNEKEKLSSQEILQRLGIVKFLRNSLEKYARGVDKSIKRGWLTKEQGAAAEKLANDLSKKMMKAEQHCNARLLLNSPRKLNATVSEAHPPKMKPIISNDSYFTDRSSRINFGESINLLFDIPPEVPPPNEFYSYFLQAYGELLKVPGDTPDEILRVKKELALKNFIFSLPSPNSPYWNDIPPEDVINCLAKLPSLSQTFLDYEQYSTHHSVCLQKIYALADRLIQKLPEDNPVKHLMLDSSFLTHALDGRAKDGFSYMTDERAEQELQEVIKYFKGKDYGSFFKEDTTVVNSDSLDDFVKNPDDRWKKNEAFFVIKYFEDNPQIKKEFTDRLRYDLKKDPTALEIIACALDGKYMILPVEYESLIQIWKRTRQYLGNVTRSVSLVNEGTAIVFKIEETNRFDRKDFNELYPGKNFPIQQSLPGMLSEGLHKMIDDTYTIHSIFDFSGYKKSHNHIMLKDVDDAILGLKAIPHQLALIGSREDKSHQILKAIVYFKQNLEEMRKNHNMQFVLSSMLFEAGLLKELLQADPANAEILIDFVKTSYERCRRTGDVANGVYFLRIGSYLSKFFQREQIPEEVTAQFPQFLHEMENWSKSETLSKEEKSILAKEYLCLYYRLKPKKLDLSHVLNQAFYLAENPISPENLAWQQRDLKWELKDFLYNDLPKRLVESGENVHAILTRSVNPDPEKPPIRWVKEGSGYTSLDGEYQIDLRDGRLYRRNGKSSVLPQNLLDNPKFREIYQPKKIVVTKTPDSWWLPPYEEVTYQHKMSEVTVTDQSTVFFRDQFHNQNRATQTHFGWAFQKKIDGVWYDHYNGDVPYHLSGYQTWQAVGSKEIVFLDQGKVVFKYDVVTNKVVCVDGSARQNLILDSKNETSNLHQFFQNFDANALFLRDSGTHVKRIELPSYQLAFEVDSEGKMCPVPYKKGYRLAKKQNIPALSRLKGYIVLENEKGQKEVLIPRRTFKPNSSFSDMLEKSTEDQFDQLPAYYTYQLDSKGRLNSDELAPLLYLSFLHVIQRNNSNSTDERDNGYELAFKILKYKSSKQAPFNEDEKVLLNLIACSKTWTSDQDARACAIRLKAKCLLLENERNFGLEKIIKKPHDMWRSLKYSGEKINEDYLSYLSQKSHAPRFKLTTEESLEIMGHAGHSDRLQRERGRLYGIKQYEGRTFGIRPDYASNIDKALDQVYLSHPFKFRKPTYKMVTRPEFFMTQFPSYYYIARHKSKNSREGRELASFLAMAKGMNEIKPFVQILQAVQKEPNEFYTFKRLQAAFNSRQGDDYYNFKPLLRELHRKAQGLETGLTQTVWYGAREGVKEEAQQFVPVSWEHHPSLEQPAILEANKEKWRPKVEGLAAKKAELARQIELLKARKNEINQEISAGHHVDQNANELRVIETQLVLAFRELATLDEARLAVSQETEFFTEVRNSKELEKRKKAGAQVADQLRQKAAEGTEPERRGAAKLLKSVESYQRKLSDQTFILEKEKIPSLKTYLKDQASCLDAHQRRLEEEILLFANQLSQDPKERQERTLELLGDPNKKITMEDLQLLYMGRNPNAFKKLNPSLSNDDIVLLCSMMEDFLLRGIKLNQIKRSISEVDSLVTIMAGKEENDPAVVQKMQDVYKTITAQNRYDPKRNPEILVFQFKANMTLFQEQIDNIIKLSEKERDLVLQMIMGAGKTSVLSVILSILKTMEKNEKGENMLSILIVPAALMDQVSQLMQTKAGEFFRQKSNAINWEDTSLLNIINTRKRLENMRKNGDLLIAKGNDIPLFFLQGRIHRGECCEKEMLSVEDIEKQEEYRKIKKLFKDFGYATLDEIEFLLNCREETHIAKGLPKAISPTYNKITAQLYTSLLSDEEITNQVYFDFTRNPKPGAKPYTPKMYDKLRRFLTIKAVNSLAELGYSERELEIIDQYLSTKPSDKPFDNSLLAGFTEQQKNDLAVLRVELHTVLPHTLNSIHGQHYGVFPAAESETPSPEMRIAGPFEGVNKPKIGSKLARYEEQQNMTRQAYAKTGIPPAYFEEQLIRIKAAIEFEYDQNQLELASQAEAYKELVWLCGAQLAAKYDIMSINKDGLAKLASDLFDSYKDDPQKIQQFVSRYIIPHIKFHEEQYSSNSQYLPSYFKKSHGFTGTLVGVNTLHKRFKTQLQEDIDGEILTSVSKDGENEILSFHTTEPESLITRMMTNTDTNNCLAIIDQGGLFKDISQEKLAIKILELRADLEAVVYFDGERKMILKREAKPVAFTSQTDVDSKKRLTIYDQIHCRGIHIDQAIDGLAIVTENKNGILSADEQAVFRMRGISKSQNVKFVVPQDLYAILQASSKSKTPNAVDLALLLEVNQDKQEKEDNLMALRQKMAFVIYEKIDSLLDSVPVIQLNSKKYRELERLTLTVNKDKPFEEHGTVGVLDDADKVLMKERERMLQSLIQWQTKNHENVFDFAQLRAEMDGLIKEAVDKKQIADKLSTTIEMGKSVSVKASQMVQQQAHVAVQQQQQQQQQQQLQQKKEQELNVQQEEEVRSVKPDRIIEKVKMDRMFEDRDFFDPIKWKGSIGRTIKGQKKKRNPCWIAMKELLGIQDKAKVVDTLFGDLPFYVPIDLAFVENVSTKTNKAFGPHQKPLGFCLIVKEGDQLKFYPLDGFNAEKCKKALIKNRKSSIKHDRQICLYHPDLGIYQQGANPIKMAELSKNNRFIEMNTVFKFLCGKISGYSKKEKELLKERLGRQENIEEVKKFFKRVLLRNNKDKANFNNSPLAAIFKDIAKEKAQLRVA